ncbi:hypothetical protein OHC33_010140 [Knufia fluminis]|uniref:Uncharacterized protein n=1 Tax=Knufia fluminis TaxID=191047 RepID=A0AAN8I2L1_9EURO|nr:hypothetical protein OHC33_010140 [Knufia fluminis]
MRPTTLLLFTTLATSYPIYATLNIDKSTGALRPSSLITRQLDLLDLTASDNADSPTGSSTSVCGLLGCGSSSESASDVTSSSSSSACQALGGCYEFFYVFVALWVGEFDGFVVVYFAWWEQAEEVVGHVEYQR